MRAASYSAIRANIPNTRAPCAVVVVVSTSPLLSDRTPTPRACRVVTMSMRSRRLRPSRSIRQMTRVSPGADRRGRALVWLLARWADWRTPLLTRPTWAVLMAGTSRRRSWLAARLAWLRERGLLAVVEHGSTPATRAAPLAGLAGNRAAVYL